ncbi:hypothetical protein [Altererythrobacter sp. ZODW24]|uniref:hypothetical protein n=1 Tax=Altererythrobacter sp. ZODW24 TaxID=2185142 RepID=UPI0013B4127F|nr:hypothetical protein [Altererythrobacter sp. ZODW24]
MKRSYVITFLVGGALGLVGGWWLQKQNLIDACLDAGGRWETNGSYCDGAVFLGPE